MSPRKPTIDDIDDVDDEDGVAEDEAAEESDLTLHEDGPAAMGRRGPGPMNRATAPEAGDPYLTDHDEEDEA